MSSDDRSLNANGHDHIFASDIDGKFGQGYYDAEITGNSIFQDFNRQNSERERYQRCRDSSTSQHNTTFIVEKLDSFLQEECTTHHKDPPGVDETGISLSAQPDMLGFTYHNGPLEAPHANLAGLFQTYPDDCVSDLQSFNNGRPYTEILSTSFDLRVGQVPNLRIYSDLTSTLSPSESQNIDIWEDLSDQYDKLHYLTGEDKAIELHSIVTWSDTQTTPAFGSQPYPLDSSSKEFDEITQIFLQPKAASQLAWPEMMLSLDEVSGSNPAEIQDPLVCSICGAKFQHKKDCRRHRKDKHYQQLPDTVKYLCTKEGCKYATEGFVRKDKRDKHMQTHRELTQPGSLNAFKSGGTIFDALDGLDSYSSIQNNDSGLKELASHDSSAKNEFNILHDNPDQIAKLIKQEKVKKCPYPGCSSEEFSTPYDLNRHVKTLHGIRNNKQYRCHAIGCKKRDKIWTRLDNFRLHVRRAHGDEDEQSLVSRSEINESNANATVLIHVSMNRNSQPHIK